MDSTRSYDITIFGATGYSGKLILQYFVEKGDHKNIRLAVAGRSEEKLKELLEAQKATGIVTVLKADVSDISSIDKMVKDCKVLINCVGPFAMYADPVVHSCVENHTDYLDITGEPNFLYDVIHKYHDKAVQNETLVIPAAAFDSVPADLLMAYSAKIISEIKATNPQYNECDVNCVVSMKGGGGLSHGTFRTAVEGIANPPANSRIPQKIGSPKYLGIAKSWVFPFPTTDPFVVRRSHDFFSNDPNAKNTQVGQGHNFEKFRYNQYFKTAGFIQWATMLVGLALFSVALKIKPVYNYVINSKKTGDGPEKHTTGTVRFTEYITLRSSTSALPEKQIVTSLNAKMGYFLTAQLMGECALAVLHDREKLLTRGGVRSPVSVLEPVLFKRVEPFITFSTDKK